MSRFNMLTGIENALRRVTCIQKAFKTKRAYDQARLADIGAWMDQGMATLMQRDKQNKKLRDKFPNFLQ